MASGGDGVSAFPAGDSLFDWVGTINVSRGCRGEAAGAQPLEGLWPTAIVNGRPTSAPLLNCSPRLLAMPADPPCLCSPRLQGADGTAYEGCTFRLSLKFTSEYPFKPPTVRAAYSGCRLQRALELPAECHVPRVALFACSASFGCLAQLLTPCRRQLCRCGLRRRASTPTWTLMATSAWTS